MSRANKFINIMSYIYHRNGKQAWSGSYAYHENGKQAWSGSYAYHENGKQAWSGSYAYHANGKQAWSGSYAYYEDGSSAGNEGIEIELGPGIRMYAGRSGFRLYVLGNCVVSE